MNYLLIDAHLKQDLFNCELVSYIHRHLAARGNCIERSELYSIGFNNSNHYHKKLPVKSLARFNKQNHEQFSIEINCFEDRVLDEIDKIEWADTIIIHYPMQWLKTPQIILNYLDEVFELNKPSGQRWYDPADLADKTFIAALATNASQEFYNQNGLRFGAEELIMPVKSSIQNATGVNLLKQFTMWDLQNTPTPEQNSIIGSYKEFVGLSQNEKIANIS